jgi:hypothetical protein
VALLAAFRIFPSPDWYPPKPYYVLIPEPTLCIQDMASAAGRRRKGKAIAAIARPEKEAIPAPDDTPSISTSGLTVDEEKTLGECPCIYFLSS